MTAHPNAKDISGERFGKLIAVEPTHNRSDNKILWLCQCDCGGEKLAVGSRLKAGYVTSCGCARSEAARSDIAGDVYGRWTVLRYAEKSHWLCRCECGTEREIATSNLRSGKTTSCGCLRTELQTTHGLSHTREYKIWSGMRERCDNPKREGFEYYGGRGIRVCERWSVFENFFADMGVASVGYSLDRIDANGNYEPSNCRWATWATQHANKRSSRQVAMDGFTIAELEQLLAEKRAAASAK
jgi:hypothetical protein